jgi:DNA-binding transcriptional ArsR family regulator
MNDMQQLGFRALADPTRREILVLLSHGEMTIAEVADNFQMTRAAVKKHLSVLHEGELIMVRTDGRTRVNSLQKKGMERVFDWVSYFDDFWDDRLSSLKSTIEKDIQ